MHIDRLALSGAFFVLMGVAGGCGGGGERSTGIAVVIVTLSRHGCLPTTPRCPGGPGFDHVPQAGERVIATSTAGRAWTATTNARGVARVVLLPGAYEVSAPGTDMGPRPETVRPADTTRVRFDAVAP